MTIDNLIIEVTRKCNMTCEHCLRGEAQNKEISKEAMIRLLLDNDVDYIPTVTFTGGEPSLSCKAINDFIDICEENSIEVGSFYIATNGKQVTDEFILTCLKLYLICSNNDDCSAIQVSRSDYHINQDEEGIQKLKALRFFSERPHLSYTDVISGGRGIELNKLNRIKGRKIKIYPLAINTDDWVEGEVYLNVKGDICTSCDLSYRRQDCNKIGNVFKNTLKQMIENKNEYPIYEIEV